MDSGRHAAVAKGPESGQKALANREGSLAERHPPRRGQPF